ncbi:MAG TPA: hypothetical protein VIS48_12160 [Candidatus Kryptonia bacterium]
MNPQDLIGPSSPLGNPAPFWFITTFKVLGFILHMIPMNIWYAGMVLVAIFGTFGKGNSELLANRLGKSMPIIVAIGVNLGIVPLLFTQVGYYQFYYPAGVLIGWAWFSVIILLLVAYYGVYAYSLSVRKQRRTRFAMTSAWVSSILFIIIGFLFANNFSLMVNVDNWIGIFNRTNVAGAPTGIALNTSDPTLFPRWLMMFGIAIMTTAVYITVDAAFFRKEETTEEYRGWAGKFAFRFFTLGMIWFAVTGAWYIFWTLDRFTMARQNSEPLMHMILILTAVSPGLVWLALRDQRRGVTKRAAISAAVAQFLVVTLNAITRQWVQNTEISRYRDVSKEAVNIQWSPLILFLVLFVLGLAIVGWMLSKVAEVRKSELKA